MSLSGTQWFDTSKEFFTGQNLGENEVSGEGGDSLRQAWISTTANYSNTVAASSVNTATQFLYANNIHSLKGVGDDSSARKVGFIDIAAYGASNLPPLQDNLINVVTGSFNVLTNAASAIILGSALNGTLVIQHDALNSFYRTNAQATLGINLSGFNDGVTQFRDTVIGDGKGSAVVSISGTDKQLIIGGVATPGAATKLHVVGNALVSGLTAATNVLVVDESANKVGVGQTAPNHELAVNGSISASNSAFIDGAIGIGTTNPTTKLHIKADAPDIVLDITSSGAADLAELKFVQDGTTTGGIAYSKSQKNIHFKTGGSTTRMVVGSGGNVGIGTTNPNELLTVKGTISAASICASNFNLTNTLSIGGDTILGNADGDTQTFHGVTKFPSAIAAATGIEIGHTNPAKIYAGGSKIISTDACMAITGAIAIGSQAEITNKLNSFDLYIAGTDIGLSGGNTTIKHFQTGNNALNIVQDNAGSTSGLIIKPSGSYFDNTKLGIGTNTPSSTLDVAGTGTMQVLHLEGNSTTALVNTGNRDFVIRQDSSNKDMIFQLDSKSRLFKWANSDAGSSKELTLSGDANGNWAFNSEINGIDFKADNERVMTVSSDGVHLEKRLDLYPDGFGGNPAPAPALIYAAGQGNSWNGGIHELINLHQSSVTIDTGIYLPYDGMYRVAAHVAYKSVGTDQDHHFAGYFSINEIDALYWYVNDNEPWGGGGNNYFLSGMGVIYSAKAQTATLRWTRTADLRVDYARLTSISIEYIAPKSELSSFGSFPNGKFKLTYTP